MVSFHCMLLDVVRGLACPVKRVKMQRKAIQFTANLQSSMVSFTTHDEKEYLVAPCVALVPGVLNGDLVTLESVTNTFHAWNGRPVVLNHPYDDNGLSISANDPVVLANAGLGYLWNADVDDNRLRVQVWLDVAKCRKLGGDAQRVIDAVKSGEPIEVSTGYWATMRAKRGVYNEREYDEVTELIIPDHLAMLPNAVGACNWGDGCGIPRTNQRGGDVDERTLRRVITDAIKKLIPNMTVRDKFQALSTLIGEEMTSEGIDSWRWHMVDIEDNYVIIGMDNMFKRRQFSDTDGGNVTLMGEWETVHQQTTFVPVANQGMCSACAAIHAQAEEDDAEPEPEQNPEPEEEPVQDQEQGETPGEGEDDNPEREEEGMPEVTTQQADTLSTFLNENQVTREGLIDAIKMRNNQRQEWLDALKTNAGLSDEDIIGMPDKVLEKLAKTYSTQKLDEKPVITELPATFVGRGLPVSQADATTVEPLRRPQVLVNKRDQKAS